MDKSRSNYLSELFYKFLCSHDDSSIMSTTSQIEERYHDPLCIFDLFDLLRSCDDKRIRQFCIISIEKVYKLNVRNYNDEECQVIRKTLIQIIPNEKDFLLRKNLIDSLVMIMDMSCNEKIEDLFNFASEMLMNQDLFTTGLYLMHFVVKSSDNEDVVEAIPNLLKILLTTVLSEDTEVRINSFLLLDTIIWLSYDFGDLIEDICQAYQKVLYCAFYVYQNIEEIQQLVLLVSQDLTRISPSFDTYNTSLVEFIFNCVSDPNLPMNLRLLAYAIIDFDDSHNGGIITLIDCDEKEIIIKYLDVLINMSLEILRNDRSSNEFEFLWGFLHLTGTSPEGDDIFYYIWNTCDSLLKNEPSCIIKQFSLFLLTSIVESQQVSFSENILIINGFINECCNNPDEEVLIYLCRFIQEMIEFLPGIFSFFIDDIIRLLLKFSSYIDIINIIDLILNDSRPLTNLLSFLNTLINTIENSSSFQVENLFSWIASSLSNSETPKEEVYPIVFNLLNKFANSGLNIKINILRCFGNLSEIAPSSTAKDIDKIIDFVMSLFHSNDIIIANQIVKTITKIASNLAISFSIYLQNIIPFIISILNFLPILPKKNQEEEEDPNVIIILSSTFICIGTLINLYPKEMEMFCQQYLNIIFKAYENEKQLIVPTCKLIEIGVEGLKELGVDSFNLIFPLFFKIQNFESKEIISSIHTCLEKIIVSYGKQFVSENIDLLLDKILCGLEGEYLPQYLMSVISTTIDIKIIPSIFSCLFKLIYVMEFDICAYSKRIIEIVEHYITDTCNLIKGYAISIFSLIAYFDRSNDEIYNITFNNIQQLLSYSNYRLLEMLLNSFRILITANKIPFQNNQEGFLNYTESLIRAMNKKKSISRCLNSAIVLFWCSLIVNLNIIPDQEILQLALPTLTQNCNDNTTIYFTSVYFGYLLKVCPELTTPYIPYISASILSLSEHIIRNVPNSTLIIYIQSLLNLKKDELSIYVYHHQGRLLMLLKNLSKLNINI